MNKLVTILAIAAVGFATLCVILKQQRTAREAQIAALREEVEQQKAQLEVLHTARERVERDNIELRQQLDQMTAGTRGESRPEQLTQADTETQPPLTNAPAAAPEGNLGSMLSKMMSDPDTKKFIRNQQRMMVDQLYRPLIKQLGLTSEEATVFKDLLADNLVKGAEKATSFLATAAGTNRAEWVSGMAAEQKRGDEQLREFLGEQRYSIYKGYQESVGERTQLNLFRQQNDAGDYPLNDVQFEQLVVLMQEEKRNAMAALGGGAAASQDQAALDAMFSEEQGDKLMRVQESANQRAFERARAVLSPDQLQAFAAFQTNQLQMIRTGLSMARRMLAPDTAPGGQ
jgi:hypothetical protein